MLVCMYAWTDGCMSVIIRKHAPSHESKSTRAHTRALSLTHTATVEQQDPRIIGTLQYYQRNRMRTAILLTKLTTNANGRPQDVPEDAASSRHAQHLELAI